MSYVMSRTAANLISTYSPAHDLAGMVSPSDKQETTMTSTSILTDIELNAVAGGSFITQMAAAGVQGAATGTSGSFFQSATRPTTGKTKSCSSNHNGVHY